jgi:hypothetical protein
MAGHGGVRAGQGRKSKAEEVKLIESLTPLAPAALEALKKGIDSGEFPFVKLFYEYYAGKPTDYIDLTTKGKSINSQPVQRVIIEDATKK